MDIGTLLLICVTFHLDRSSLGWLPCNSGLICLPDVFLCCWTQSHGKVSWLTFFFGVCALSCTSIPVLCMVFVSVLFVAPLFWNVLLSNLLRHSETVTSFLMVLFQIALYMYIYSPLLLCFLNFEVQCLNLIFILLFFHFMAWFKIICSFHSL